MDPAARDPENPNVSYLKDLWHAVQNQEISGKEALLMGLAQRGMDTPYPKQAAGPNVPISPADPAAAPPCLRRHRCPRRRRHLRCAEPLPSTAAARVATDARAASRGATDARGAAAASGCAAATGP